MYTIIVSFKLNQTEKTAKHTNIKEFGYCRKIEKAVGREADSFWTNKDIIKLRWERKSSGSVDRILKILSKFRRIETHYKWSLC